MVCSDKTNIYDHDAGDTLYVQIMTNIYYLDAGDNKYILS